MVFSKKVAFYKKAWPVFFDASGEKSAFKGSCAATQKSTASSASRRDSSPVDDEPKALQAPNKFVNRYE
jgi:hypothetical protein